jgi:hypothetical protein
MPRLSPAQATILVTIRDVSPWLDPLDILRVWLQSTLARHKCQISPVARPWAQSWPRAQVLPGLDLFNYLRLDAFVPGNHEFDFGKEVYFQRVREARFPILAANLAAGLKLPHHHDQILIEVDGLKLALIGAAYEATGMASRPRDLVFAPTIPTVLANAKSARGSGADFVIAIVHADRMMGASLMNTHAVDLVLSVLRRWRELSMGMERVGAMPSVENCRIFRH